MSAPTATACPAPDDGPRPAQSYLLVLLLTQLLVTGDRLTETPAADAELADSLKAQGQLSPIEVAADYSILNGHRRRRVMLAMGLTHAMCRVNPAVATKQDIDRACLALDVQEKRSPLDMGLRFDRHMAETGHNQAQTAVYFGTSGPTVLRGLRAARSSQPIRAALASGEITAAHLNAVARVKDDARREALLLRAAAEDLTADALAKLARIAKPKKVSGFVEFVFAGLKVTFPSSWTHAELKKALADLSDYLAASARSFDVKALPIAAILPRREGQ